MFGQWSLPMDTGETVESDEGLRDRLLYVAGDGHAEANRIMHAAGAVLDLLADRFKLRRRRGRELDL